MATLIIDGRLLSPAEFEKHVQATDITWADRIVLHHTAIPTLATWKGASTIEAMRKTYEGYGWDSGPHLFVAPEGVWLFSSLAKPGTHVKGYNNVAIGIEVVGDYSKAPPADSSLTNAILATASLLKKMHGGRDELYYHRMLQDGTSCPGDGFVSIWKYFEDMVLAHAYAVDLSQELPTATKIRWQVEEAYRRLKALGIEEWQEPMQRIHELIKLDGGLLYRFESENNKEG